MASGEMMHITTKLSILISFQCVLCTFLPERVTAQAMLKPARDPEGARGVGSSSVSMSQASSVVGTQARWLAEGSPGEEPDPVRELLDLEEELQDLLALRYRERQRFRHCVRHWGSFQCYTREFVKRKSKAATDPETLKQMFEQKREEKEAACNVWAALLDALSEKIDAMDNERKAMQKRLTQMQFEQYLAAAAAPSRAAAGGEGSRFSSGEAADSASKSQPPGGAEGTPGDAGSVEALDRELARVRQQIKLAAKKSICCRVKLKKHLEHKPPSPTEGLFVREQLAGRAWEARRLQLEQNAEQGRETADQLRKQLQVLKQRKAAYEKAHGSSPGATGCEHAPLRFARLGITVDEREASKMWFQRPNFICLSHCSSSGPTDPAGLPRHEPRHNVFLARRQHVSRPSRKPGSKRGRSRAAEGSGKTGDEHKASTSTATSEPDSPGEGTSGIVAKTPTDDAAKRQRRSSPPRPRSPEWIESTDSSDQESPTAGVEEFKEVASTPPHSAGNISRQFAAASPSFADVISLVLQGGSPDKETAAPAMAPQRSRSPSPPQGALTEGGGKLQISEEFSGVVGGPMPSPPRPTKRQAVPRLERSSPQGEDSSSTSALTAVRLALLRGLQPTIPAGPQIGISTPPGGRSLGSPHSSPSPHSSRSSESSSRSESSTTATSSDDQGSGGREERTLAGATAVPASASPPGARPQPSQPMTETLLGAASPAIELRPGGATPLGLSGGSSLGTPSLGHPSRGASFPSSLSLFLRGRRIPFRCPRPEASEHPESPGGCKKWTTHTTEYKHAKAAQNTILLNAGTLSDTNQGVPRTRSRRTACGFRHYWKIYS